MDQFKLFNSAKAQDYSQLRYDLESSPVDKKEIQEVKNLAREKRLDYGIAPIGAQIFTYLASKEPNLFFEYQTFDNPDLDTFIIWPDPVTDSAYIVLNSNQSLLNQIFATAHGYYCYLKDLNSLKNIPRCVHYLRPQIRVIKKQTDLQPNFYFLMMRLE